MRILPVSQNEHHIEFYIVARDVQEMERMGPIPRRLDAEEIWARVATQRLGQALVEFVFKDDQRVAECRRFVRLRYENDGMWHVALVGPARQVWPRIVQFPYGDLKAFLERRVLDPAEVEPVSP